MPPLARRSYRFNGAMRAQYPAAKAFLAPQRTASERAALKVVPRAALPIREGHDPARAGRPAEESRRLRKLAGVGTRVRDLLRRSAA